METTSTNKELADVDDYNKMEEPIGSLQSNSNTNRIIHDEDQSSISNDDTNPHISIQSETTATNDSLSNISADNNGNQSLDISNVSTPSSSFVVLKNNNRTKLSSQNVRILLYLIFEVKPFKYIGDRSINQTKKWEIIQKKYAQSKKKESFDNDFVVPTVRTLQRQLASAIKKAKIKKKSMEDKGIKMTEEDINDLFQSIGLESSTDNLELALLELHEYSERLKNGKASTTPLNLDYPKNKISSLNTKSLDIIVTNRDIPQEKLDETQKESKKIKQFRPDLLLDNSSNHNTLDELVITRNNITKILGPSLQTSLNIDKLAEMIELLVSQTRNLQQSIIRENNRIIRETSQRIKENQDLCEKLIKENNKFQEDQNNINKGLLISILSNFAKPSSTSPINSETVDGTNRTNKSLNETNNVNEQNSSLSSIFKTLQNI